MYQRRRFPKVSPPKKLFRVGYGQKPTALRPWETVNRNEPLPGRFDDPEKAYRVLYTSSTPEGAYRESLQQFRPSNDLLAVLKQIEQNDTDKVKDDFHDFGMLPLSWMVQHSFAEITIDDRCDMVKVTDGASLDLIQIKIGCQLDAGTLLSADRDITQAISRLVFGAEERFAGIVAESRLGTEFVNFALFEDMDRPSELRAHVAQVISRGIDFLDPALVDVANAYSLKIPGYEEHAKRLKKIHEGDCNFDELVEHVEDALAEMYSTEKPILTKSKKSAIWSIDERNYACMNLKGSRVELTGQRKPPNPEALSEEGKRALESEFEYPPQKFSVKRQEASNIAVELGWYLLGRVKRMPAAESENEESNNA